MCERSCHFVDPCLAEVNMQVLRLLTLLDCLFGPFDGVCLLAQRIMRLPQMGATLPYEGLPNRVGRPALGP